MTDPASHYCILFEDSISDFLKEANRLIREGWTPLGAAQLQTSDDERCAWHQTFWRPYPEKKL